MNCSKTEELRKYLTGELSAGEARLLERHVEECLRCQSQMMEEEDSSEEFPSLQVPSALPTDFTAQVMMALEQLPQPKPKINWKKRSVNILKKTALAVASVTAIITFGSMVSPTFASYVNSVIQSIQGIDKGMKQAAENGYLQTINKTVTDQGITFTVKEVVADPVRMAIVADLVDQNGKRIQFDVENDDLSLTYKTKTGEDLNPGGGGFSFGEEDGYLVINHDIFQFLKDRKTLPDEMIVSVEATILGGKEGSWKVEFPVDMKKAREVANYTEIGQSYTTPHGIAINLQNIMTVPSASMLELSTVWTKERADQIQKLKEQNGWNVKGTNPTEYTAADMMERYFVDIGLAYQILDEKGNVVAGWDDALFGEEINQIQKNNVRNSYRGQVHDEGKRAIKWNGITPLAKDQKYKFKMHSLYLYEPTKFQATIPVDNLLKDKVTVTNSDSTYTFTGFTLKTTEGEEKIGNETYRGKGALISFSATLPEGIVYTNEWSALDESKQKYKAYRKENYSRGKDGRVHVNGTFFIPGLLKQPKEITLSHSVQRRQYQDLNWEVPFETSSKPKQ
ncbi:DUF4179 domain-containing protein [Brevibacillus sp. 179-C9.3 HS]|uniref:DUF4179 domain-containing protein n=1 Tax=unclassified Brevibacillus TaxID=2684853 RepID=UPI00399FBFD8